MCPKDSQGNLIPGHIFSTDDYFLNAKGEYIFNGKDIPLAHQWNQDRATKAMAASVTPVIIDNTHTQKWEARCYAEKGLDYGYDISFQEADTPWKRDVVELAQRNAHGVPKDGIERMLSRWENDFTLESVLNSTLPNPKHRGKNKQK